MSTTTHYGPEGPANPVPLKSRAQDVEAVADQVLAWLESQVDEKGELQTSLDIIASELHRSKGSVHAAVRLLKDSHELEITYGRYKHATYRLITGQ